MNSDRTYSVAVVGATGVVGTEMLRVLSQRGFPVGELKALATARSAGRRLGFDGRTVTVEELTEDSFAGVELALFSAGAEASRRFAPAAAAAGALVVDNSSAWRMDPEVPLVVPEVNAGELRRASGIVANPNCCAIPLTVALAPIRDAVGLERVVVATYQSASGAGKRLMDELESQVRQYAASEAVTASAYPHQLFHNVVPGGWRMQEEDYNQEEWKLVEETRKILAEPELRIVATCVRVPVPISHAEAVFVETRDKLTAAQARELLSRAPGIRVVDDPAGQVYPTPHGVAGTDEVFVGRIRNDLSHERGLALWVVADNLRKGAALNAVQCAEAAIGIGVL